MRPSSARKLASLIGLVAILAATPSFAGGPLANCQPGQPYLWPNGGTNITFNPDQGNLGPVGGAAAIALVGSAFQAWEDIPSATMTYVAGAQLPVDVDITNFGPYLNAVAPDGLSAVVFDDTGEIFDLLFGPGSGILGFAGPEWATPATCTITEGLSFLNGPSFTNAVAAEDVMVHEFGHWTNFAHTAVNGQVYLGSVGGDNTGPTPFDTFGAPPNPFTDVVETMYPFYYGPPIGTATPEADDIAIASRMYPEPNYASTTGTISGTVLLGGSRVSGVNVIARNVANPFLDAVSAISSDFTDNTAQSDPNVGVYTITGLTPGASYGVYIDEILAGGFSTPLSSPLPGPEELYNGASESSDPNVDDPSQYTPVVVAAGSPVTGIDIIFNQPAAGDPLPVGDDGAVQLALPFQFCVHGQGFDSVFVNANGSLTFGAADSDFSESDAEFRDGPARVAPLWHDLNPTTGGSVFYDATEDSFTVTWQDVPEWFDTGANSFSVTLFDNSKACREKGGRGHDLTDGDDDYSDDDDSYYGEHKKGHRDDDDDDGRGRADIVIDYTGLEVATGLAGVTGGLAVTGGLEIEVDLSALSRDGDKKIKVDKSAAVFENFSAGDSDLDGLTLEFDKVGKAFKDKFEKNDSLKKAAKISLPFSTADTRHAYSAIDPPAGDIDFFRMRLEEGTTLLASVARGQIDSVMGLWFCEADDAGKGKGKHGPKVGKCDPDEAIFIGFNDDVGTGSNPLLSGFLFQVPITGTYAIGVTFCCDYDFDGVDPGQGPPFDGGRYVLDLKAIDGEILPLGDDSSVEVPLGFSFPFQGSSHSSVFVNSNGNLTFGAGDSDWSESVSELLGGPPRIAPLWDDLSPNLGGLVYYKADSGSLTVTFDDVPEFGTTNGNSFSVTLWDTGDVVVEYGAVASLDGLAGVSEGGGAADPGGTDLSAGGPFSAVGTTYQLFTAGDPFDLNGQTLAFDHP